MMTTVTDMRPKDLKQKLSDIQHQSNQLMNMLISEAYPHLKITIDSDNFLSIYVKATGRYAGYHAHILYYSEEKLADMDKQAQIVEEDKDNYFFCAGCNKAQPKSQYKGCGMADDYCNTCYYKSASVRALLKESSKRGFYD